MQNTSKSDYFGKVVKSARQAKGLTQFQLADLLDITPRYLKAIENSGRKPSHRLLVHIIEELAISADTLLKSEKKKDEALAKITTLWKTGTQGKSP